MEKPEAEVVESDGNVQLDKVLERMELSSLQGYGVNPRCARLKRWRSVICTVIDLETVIVVHFLRERYQTIRPATGRSFIPFSVHKNASSGYPTRVGLAHSDLGVLG